MSKTPKGCSVQKGGEILRDGTECRYMGRRGREAKTTRGRTIVGHCGVEPKKVMYRGIVIAVKMCLSERTKLIASRGGSIEIFGLSDPNVLKGMCPRGEDITKRMDVEGNSEMAYNVEVKEERRRE